MKNDIHPPYHDQVTVTCSCGHTWQTGSTSEAISIEVCSNCHPFYTGKSKLVDTTGRVDRFQQRLKNMTPKQKSGRTAHPKKSRKNKTDTAVKLG